MRKKFKREEIIFMKNLLMKMTILNVNSKIFISIGMKRWIF